MTGRKKDPLRKITEEEREWLERIGRSQSEPASHVVAREGNFGGGRWMQLYPGGGTGRAEMRRSRLTFGRAVQSGRVGGDPAQARWWAKGEIHG